ncbi:hypothetical protein LCGC14_3147480 [marine sediment metagenome]|uniref:Uncharacterized protein n=1 Tax=marine sediment metagenome TaxID=412755 RepID=A0A0F8VV49_9ZZZZ
MVHIALICLLWGFLLPSNGPLGPNPPPRGGWYIDIKPLKNCVKKIELLHYFDKYGNIPNVVQNQKTTTQAQADYGTLP